MCDESSQGAWVLYENGMKDGRLSVGISQGKREGSHQGEYGEEYIKPVCSIGHPLGAGVFEGERENADFIIMAHSILPLLLADREELLEKIKGMKGMKDALEKSSTIMLTEVRMAETDGYLNALDDVLSLFGE